MDDTQPGQLNDSGVSTSPSLPSPSATKRKGDQEDVPSKKRSRKSKAGPNELSCPLCDYTTR